MIVISEELLIDFRELSGEHSGENMAEVVWETLKRYDLIGRVSSSEIIIAVRPVSVKCLLQIISFVMDNATNNNTLVAAIEQCCTEANIYFSAMESRMRCMPHTVHLAAIKVQSNISCDVPVIK